MLPRFKDTITRASEAEIRRDPTLAGSLVIERQGDIVMSYAPFERVQASARVVLVGITPGAQQATNALASARRDLLDGLPDDEVLARAKAYASFSGAMRGNLVAMLDSIGVARWLSVRALRACGTLTPVSRTSPVRSATPPSSATRTTRGLPRSRRSRCCADRYGLPGDKGEGAAGRCLGAVGLGRGGRVAALDDERRHGGFASDGGLAAPIGSQRRAGRLLPWSQGAGTAVAEDEPGHAGRGAARPRRQGRQPMRRSLQ